jgi:hypothetical protein
MKLRARGAPAILPDATPHGRSRVRRKQGAAVSGMEKQPRQFHRGAADVARDADAAPH